MSCMLIFLSLDYFQSMRPPGLEAYSVQFLFSATHKRVYYILAVCAFNLILVDLSLIMVIRITEDIMQSSGISIRFWNQEHC